MQKQIQERSLLRSRGGLSSSQFWSLRRRYVSWLTSLGRSGKVSIGHFRHAPQQFRLSATFSLFSTPKRTSRLRWSSIVQAKAWPFESFSLQGLSICMLVLHWILLTCHCKCSAVWSPNHRGRCQSRQGGFHRGGNDRVPNARWVAVRNRHALETLNAGSLTWMPDCTPQFLNQQFSHCALRLRPCLESLEDWVSN